VEDIMRIDKIYSDMIDYLREKVNKQEKPDSEKLSSKSGESSDVRIENRIEVELEAVSKEKVESIKAAISKGEYVVDVHKISEAMLREFLGE
jgi:negative regulator of flagellin synthesis FlgM